MKNTWFCNTWMGRSLIRYAGFLLVGWLIGWLGFFFTFFEIVLVFHFYYWNIPIHFPKRTVLLVSINIAQSVCTLSKKGKCRTLMSFLFLVLKTPQNLQEVNYRWNKDEEDGWLQSINQEKQAITQLYLVG